MRKRKDEYLARLGPHTPSECGVLQEDGLDVASWGLLKSAECRNQRVSLFAHIEKGRYIYVRLGRKDSRPLQIAAAHG
jgi:hypothetical protein